MSSPTGGALEIGRVLQGRYELKQRLSDSGVGAVFAARDRQTGRDVIVKSVLEGNERAQALLLREARLQSSLADSDAPVPKPLAQFVDGGSIFLVQELVEGKPLTEWQQHRTVGEIVDLYARLAKALASLHASGIIHRDLKPDNVLVRKSDGQPLLLDLGLAVATHERDELTSTGALVGTPTYFAPEVILGKPLGAPTDIYSFGVMLFEVLLGKLPWSSDSFMTIAASILRLDRDAILAPLRPLGPLGMTRLIRAILDSDPEKRPDAQAVADELERFADTFRSIQKSELRVPLDPPALDLIASWTGKTTAIHGTHTS